jgi:hypothetical protein
MLERALTSDITHATESTTQATPMLPLPAEPSADIKGRDDSSDRRKHVGVSRAIVRHLVKHGVTPEMKLIRVAYGRCDARSVDLFSRPIKKLVRVGFVVSEPAKAVGDGSRVYRVTQSGREWLALGNNLPSPLFGTNAEA